MTNEMRKEKGTFHSVFFSTSSGSPAFLLRLLPLAHLFRGSSSPWKVLTKAARNAVLEQRMKRWWDENLPRSNGCDPIALAFYRWWWPEDGWCITKALHISQRLCKFFFKYPTDNGFWTTWFSIKLCNTISSWSGCTVPDIPNIKMTAFFVWGRSRYVDTHMCTVRRPYLLSRSIIHLTTKLGATALVLGTTMWTNEVLLHQSRPSSKFVIRRRDTHATWCPEMPRHAFDLRWSKYYKQHSRHAVIHLILFLESCPASLLNMLRWGWRWCCRCWCSFIQLKRPARRQDSSWVSRDRSFCRALTCDACFLLALLLSTFSHHGTCATYLHVKIHWRLANLIIYLWPFDARLLVSIWCNTPEVWHFFVT